MEDDPFDNGTASDKHPATEIMARNFKYMPIKIRVQLSVGVFSNIYSCFTYLFLCGKGVLFLLLFSPALRELWPTYVICRAEEKQE